MVERKRSACSDQILRNKVRSNTLLFWCLRWKHVGESLLAMYRHQTTCEPPRPSLGRRIDLSEYRDPNCLQNLPPPSSPVSVGQTTVLSSSPSSSLPPVTLPEPAVLPHPGPLVTPSHATVEVVPTAAAPPVGECRTLLYDDEQQLAVS